MISQVGNQVPKQWCNPKMCTFKKITRDKIFKSLEVK